VNWSIFARKVIFSDDLKAHFCRFDYRLLRPVVLAVSIVLASGCGQDFIPKERGYHKIELPTAAYISLDSIDRLPVSIPYTFDVSRYARVRPDSDKYSEPYWLDIYYPQFDATVELTYKPLKAGKAGKITLNELIEDGRKLTNKHQIKASGITESSISTAGGNVAKVFRLAGQVPTQYQFFVTDSSRHYMRGALYFRTATANDSLAPIIEFISKDMDQLLTTLRWK
jgi:gliding motility-associated lipoprotein GldD